MSAFDPKSREQPSAGQPAVLFVPCDTDPPMDGLIEYHVTSQHVCPVLRSVSMKSFQSLLKTSRYYITY